MFSYEKYEIRLESIGGLGANLVGKLLGQLGAGSGIKCSIFRQLWFRKERLSCKGIYKIQ